MRTTWLPLFGLLASCGGTAEDDGGLDTDLTHDDLPCENPALEPQSESFLFVLDGSDVSFAVEERRLTIERAGTTLYFLAGG